MRNFIILILLFSFGFSQPDDTGLTLERYPILVLPADTTTDSESIEVTLTNIVGSQATNLNRFDVIDRAQLESILNEQALQMSGIVSDEDVVEAGRVASAKEALVVKVINFGQKGVPPEDEEEEDEKDRKEARKSGLFGVLAKGIVDAVVDKAMEDVERYPNNIQTVIQAEVRKIDIESGKSVASFPINVTHTGGNLSKSLGSALAVVTAQVSSELRNLYLLTSELLDVNGEEIMLLLGHDLGLESGMRFEIVTPEVKRTVRDREITIPGRSVGLVKVDEVSGDASRGRVLRSWDDLEPGYRAVEYLKPVFSMGILLATAPANTIYRLEFQATPLPFERFIAMGVFNLGTIKDTFDDTDFSFGIGAKLGWKFLHGSGRSIGFMLSLPMHFASRSDDKSHIVILPIFAPSIGASTAIQISKSRDIIFNVDYVFTSAKGSWKYSKDNDDDETDMFDAEWDDDAPDVKPEGLYFSLGMRFLTL
ncbi:MAG: hypothetical protein HQ509_09725 [Candidatus Marinimicrobia bacterium]|nr:hypothetical protein [Candidatus Neomarinimicrobiota bacterium]